MCDAVLCWHISTSNCSLIYWIIPISFFKGVPEVYIGSVNYTVRYGQGVTLNCTVVSSPPHTEVFWEKKRQLNNGITIIRQGESGTSGSTNNMPALTINATRTTDPGHYFCAAKNMVGIGLSQETVLNVIGGMEN